MFMATGMLAGGVFITAAIAKVIPTHLPHISVPGSNTGRGDQGNSFQNGTGADGSGLAGPQQTPQQSYQAPVASSGGS